MLLAECIQEYMDDCYALREGTRNLYLYHLERLLRDVGNLAIKAIKPKTIRNFMAHLRRQDGKAYSLNYQDQVFRTLNTFFNWLVLEETLLANPMGRVRRPDPPDLKSPRLSLDQVERLLEAIGQTEHAVRNLAIVCMMLDSGLRRGEVLNLPVSKVDTEAGVARVLGMKNKREREVPLSEPTYEALRAYLQIRSATDAEELFVTEKGTPLSKNGLQSFMYRLKKQAGIPELRCHLLRHTFANHYINGGGGLRKLSKILGHSNVKTTADFYTDPELQELQNEHARVSPLVQVARKQKQDDSH